MKKGLNLHY